MSIEITEEMVDAALLRFTAIKGEPPLKAMRAALTAVAPLMQAKVPEGSKLVPIEPTGAMLLNCVGICRSAEDASRAYKAMLAAAPEVQS
jgi:hypothetical protein